MNNQNQNYNHNQPISLNSISSQNYCGEKYINVPQKSSSHGGGPMRRERG